MRLSRSVFDWAMIDRWILREFQLDYIRQTTSVIAMDLTQIIDEIM